MNAVKETKPQKKQEQPAQQPPDPYWIWLQNATIVQPDDVAVFVKGSSRIIVLTDAFGKSVLNVGLQLRKDLLDKIVAEEKK